MLPLQPVDVPAGRLALRPWRPDDARAVWAALQDPEIRRWNGTGVRSAADAAHFVAQRADWSAGDHASWAVVDSAGDVLGSVSVHSVDVVQNDAEIGYWTAPAARGQGVAGVAVDAACRWAFAVVPVDRIELCHAVENVASGRVAEKSGFTLEGRMRRSYRYADGVKHDELLWARLAGDPGPALSIRS